MPIWFEPGSVKEVNERAQVGIARVIGLEITEFGEDYIAGRMPVDERTRQPFGILHGGASVVLAETLASVGCSRTLDRSKYRAVGLEIHANHLAAAKDGWVTAVARPVHLGRTTQVWDIRITNAEGKLSCISRCTMAIIERK